MAVSLKELAKREDLLSGGHRACAGCACATTLRQVLLAASETNLVCGLSTGCMEVVTTIYPYTAWKCSFIHSAFENVAVTIAGVETAYHALKDRGKITDEYKFIAMGGDGGSYDIGLQALSGVMERGHDMVYICYDNEAYMNTGIQRSGATPMGAHTSTSPAGKVVPGKQGHRKDLTQIMVAHGAPYVAQASPHNYRDLTMKVKKALGVKGPAYIGILASCHRGWRIKQEESISTLKVAVDTCFWPLYEVEDGKYKINYKPKEKLPITDWIKSQGRFAHLFREENNPIIDELQREVDRKWEDLLAKAG
jgi:pyruvate ferredoxin oxidoreductase beta subunit